MVRIACSLKRESWITAADSPARPAKPDSASSRLREGRFRPSLIADHLETYRGLEEPVPSRPVRPVAVPRPVAARNEGSDPPGPSRWHLSAL